MSTRVFVPRDSAARSVGADAVAEAVARESAARGVDVVVTRNGSRGLFWLEPLVEVETAQGRVGYGPVSQEDVPGLFAARFLEGGAHALRQGTVEEIPYLARQERLTFARAGITDPLSLADYEAHGGWAGLKRALSMEPAAIVEEVVASGLRGRGGAGFPTGLKWRTVLEQPATPKYVACNADEGDSGNFADRMVMEDDPFELIEGMIIAGIATGATYGYVYIRSEYPDAIAVMEEAIGLARGAGWLGESLAGSTHRFDMEVRVGAGAYVCGEETAMLESIEGKRGLVRAKPPLPAIVGLFGQPTVVNNVLSLATVPVIMAKGAQFYAEFGMGRSRGTLPVQLAGNVKHGGLIETAFGMTLREVIYDFGGGTATGRPLRAVQVGGPLGAYFTDEMLDVAVDYESMSAAGGLLGHGGIVVFDDSVDMAKQARFAMEFCAFESCGKCTPCRIGSTRGFEVLDRIMAGNDRQANVALLDDLCSLMADASLCDLGRLIPLPVRSALRYFPEDFDRPAPANGRAPAQEVPR
jgi:formate dehydrogenase iron-sulfur subunit